MAWAVAVAVTLIVVFDWVPTPLNRNIACAGVSNRVIGTGVHSSVGALMVAAAVLNWEWVVLAGAIWFSVVLFSAVLNWWVPWLTGWTPGEITPAAYLAGYTRNVRFLPRSRHSPIVPDVQHTLIHAAVLVATVLSWTEFIRL